MKIDMQMTTNVLARFHCATETIEAVHYEHFNAGGYVYGVRFFGGKHADMETRCHTEQSAIRLFNEAKAARTQGRPLWWLDIAA